MSWSALVNITFIVGKFVDLRRLMRVVDGSCIGVFFRDLEVDWGSGFVLLVLVSSIRLFIRNFSSCFMWSSPSIPSIWVMTLEASLALRKESKMQFT